MNRRSLLIATGTAATTALAGCLGAGEESPEAGSGTPAEPTRTIIVSNTGEVDGEPDLAVLQVGVETTADSARAARDELARSADELTSALREYGIDDEKISTRRYRIRERIDRRRMEEDGVRPNSREEAEEYIHYEGTHSFTVEIEPIDDVGEVIDTAVDAGADEIQRVTFTLSEERRAQLREDALRNAIQGARSEAETIADEVGASIVEATVVDASEGRVSPIRRDVAFESDAHAASTPDSRPPTAVEPGDVTVTADVNIRYEMA